MAFDPITSIFDLGKTLIDKLIPDPGAQAVLAATQLRFFDQEEP